MRHGWCEEAGGLSGGGRTQRHDLRWRQPLRAQCLIDVGPVCCGGNVTIKTVRRATLRPGARNVVRLHGIIDGGKARACGDGRASKGGRAQG